MSLVQAVTHQTITPLLITPLLLLVPSTSVLPLKVVSAVFSVLLVVIIKAVPDSHRSSIWKNLFLVCLKRTIAIVIVVVVVVRVIRMRVTLRVKQRRCNQLINFVCFSFCTLFTFLSFRVFSFFLVCLVFALSWFRQLHHPYQGKNMFLPLFVPCP